MPTNQQRNQFKSKVKIYMNAFTMVKPMNENATCKTDFKAQQKKKIHKTEIAICVLLKRDR